MKQSEFERLEITAVFLGLFDTELELDEYLWDGFEKDFDLQLDEEGFLPEVDVNEEGPLPVGQLLEKFSWPPAIEAVQRADELGFATATAAVLVYGIKYDPRLIRNHLAPLTFIGNF